MDSTWKSTRELGQYPLDVRHGYSPSGQMNAFSCRSPGAVATLAVSPRPFLIRVLDSRRFEAEPSLEIEAIEA
jgi:hypothetical protein